MRMDVICSQRPSPIPSPLDAGGRGNIILRIASSNTACCPVSDFTHILCMQVFFWIPSAIGVRDKLFSKGGEDYSKNQESCKGRLKDGDCDIRGSRL